jgi:hypothetical protein
VSNAKVLLSAVGWLAFISAKAKPLGASVPAKAKGIGVWWRFLPGPAASHLGGVRKRVDALYPRIIGFLFPAMTIPLSSFDSDKISLRTALLAESKQAFWFMRAVLQESGNGNWLCVLGPRK